MGKKAWAIVSIAVAVVFAAMSLVAVLMGGCSSMLELANGNSVPMKCHWTFTADAYIGVIGVVVALMGATCKDQSGRRAAGAGVAACALVAACMPASFGIGLCADSAMHCHSTAAIVWALCAVAGVVGIVQIVKSRPTDTRPPRR